jgi:hypothetical protein
MDEDTVRDKTGRMSIATWMLVIVVVALNCVIWRSNFGLSAIVYLPMLDLLAFGLWRWGLRAKQPHFWIAFEIVGWPMLGLVLLGWWYDREYVDRSIFFRPIFWLEANGWISEDDGDGPVKLTVAYLVAGVLYLVPPVLPAICAGWLSSRFRIVIEPRPRVLRNRLEAAGE